MTTAICSECHGEFSYDNTPRRGIVCFRCHLRGIRLGFTYGKQDFHGPTIRERQREQEHVAAAAGIDAAPVGRRWV